MVISNCPSVIVEGIVKVKLVSVSELDTNVDKASFFELIAKE